MFIDYCGVAGIVEDCNGLVTILVNSASFGRTQFRDIGTGKFIITCTLGMTCLMSP